MQIVTKPCNKVAGQPCTWATYSIVRYSCARLANVSSFHMMNDDTHVYINAILFRWFGGVKCYLFP